MTDNLDRRILPFLWVHGESEDVYREMVKAIYDANIRAFCVEARPHEGFCQEPWWRDMAILLDEAEKRGMRVWILDDKHFPTGFAAGEAQKAPIELRRQGLLHKRFPVEKGTIRLNAAEQAHPPEEKSQIYQITDQINQNNTPQNTFHDDALLSVAAIRLDRKAEPIDLTDRLQNGVLDWTAPEGKWELQLCCLSRNIGTHRSYINMMDRESCRIQIDAVYEPHYRHFGDKFGTVIAGFFSDEPELGNNSMYKMYNLLGTEQDLPWSRELAAALEEKLGRGYAALLPLLWSNDCDPFLTAKVRHAFMDSVSRLVEEDFSHQIGQWCREHDVEYIGHVVEDNNQHARTGTSLGHFFRGLKWQSMAGIDDIGGQVEPGMEDSRRANYFGDIEDGEFYHYTLGKLGSSLGSTFVGQLIQREKVHLDHGIFGSPDLDQSGKLSAWLQSKLVVPLLTSFTSEKKQAKTREKLKSFFEMNDETADRFMACFSEFNPESIKNEYYTDLLTWLKDDIHVEGTKVHFIYANKMGEKYRKRYRKYFRDPEIREFDMQHEQWLFGGEQYTAPVLKAIDEFMELKAE